MQKKLRVLVVDDKAPVLLTYRMILQQNGYDVVAVPTYEDAVGELNGSQFDLVVSDLGLDGNRNGFEVIEYAKKKVPGIGSVLLTGYATEDVQVEAEQRGVVVLFKPIQVRELLKRLDSAALEQRSAIA